MEKQTKNIYQNTKFIIAVAILCNFLWGCAIPSVKIGYRLFQVAAGDAFSQSVFAGTRFLGAGLFTLLISVFTEKKAPALPVKLLPGTFLLAMIQTALQYFFFYVGLAHTTGVRGAILNATNIFMAVILAGIIWRTTDGITLKKLLGCGIGFLGVVVVNISGVSGAQGFTFLGDGLLLLSSFCLACASPLTKILAARVDPILLTGWQLVIGGGSLLLFGLVSGGRLVWAGWKGVALMFFMMMITTIAFPIWTNLLKHNPVGKISVYNFLTPVFGVVTSTLLLGENTMGISLLIALILVCVGIIIVNIDLKKKN